MTKPNKFYTHCVTCDGKGSVDIPSENLTGVECQQCEGKGFIPTAEGSELLKFLDKMGILPLLLAWVLTLSACGKIDACAPFPLVGNWTSGTYGQLTLKADCSGSRKTGLAGDGSQQMAVFSFELPKAGALPVLVTSTTGGAFLPPAVGAYNCAFNDAVAGQLTVDCGLGAMTFNRVN